MNFKNSIDHFMYNRTNKILCNICGERSVVVLENLRREISSCNNCKSSVRMRQLIYFLTIQLFGAPKVLSELPVQKNIFGAGLSDWDGYAKYLDEKFTYTNTYYHMEPQLDITTPSSKWLNSLDFLISSDVFEHVVPPVQKAFDGAYSILKPGGSLILTVPYTIEGHTTEWFPDLHDFKIIQIEDNWVLENKTVGGKKQTFKDLIFHGGPGSTLEIRQFALNDLLNHLENAGFRDVKVQTSSAWKYGMHMPESWSLPITAKKY